MKAKEKAYEIINKMSDYAAFTDEDCCLTERETMYKNSKSLALLQVNEIINEINIYFLEIYDAVDRYYFWIQVREEIEKFETL